MKTFALFAIGIVVIFIAAGPWLGALAIVIGAVYAWQESRRR